MNKEYHHDNLRDVAEEFLTLINEKKGITGKALVIGLKGDLGAGKTTLVKEVAKLMGVENDVVSPTFVLRRDYFLGNVWENLIHIDAYRLETPEMLEQVLKQDEINNSKNLIIIEWPEKVDMGIFDMVFNLAHKDEFTRKIEVL